MAQQAIPPHLHPPGHSQARDPAPQLRPVGIPEKAAAEEKGEDRLLAKAATALLDVDGGQDLSHKRLAMPVAMPDRR